MSAYELRRDGPVPMLGRKRIYRTIATALTKPSPDHVSVIGPRLSGKSVILRHLWGDAAVTANFSFATYWDVRRETPSDDDEFRRALARHMADALRGGPLDDLLDETLDYEWVKFAIESAREQTNKPALLILDGLDAVLDRRSVSRQLWDNLKALGDKGATMVCGSRARLVDICDHEASSSDFWDMFGGAAVEVGPFSEDDWPDLLAPIEKRRAVEGSARKELAAWTGGQPRLTCEMLHLLDAQEGSAPIAKPQVDAVAEALLRERPESLTLLWKRECDESLRGVLADLVANESLPASQVAPRDRGRLAALGMVLESGSKVSCASRLMARHIQGTGGGEHNLRRLFASESDYAKNVGGLLELRLAHVKGGDPRLRGYVEKALRDLTPDDPRGAWRVFRDIVDRALDLVWSVEAPGGILPDAWKEPLRERYPPDRKAPKRGQACEFLDKATGYMRQAPVAQHVTKRTVVLLDALKQAGDMANHADELKMPAVLSLTGSAVFCAVAVELFAAITEEIPLKA